MSISIPLPVIKMGLVVSDNATGVLGFDPQVNRTKGATTHDFLHFEGVGQVRLLYCDSAGELVESGYGLNWVVGASTPGEPSSVGVVERGSTPSIRLMPLVPRG